MRALLCRAWGSVENLRIEEVEAPVAADDEVLIDVKATSVNYADAIMVAGNYQTRPDFPFSPGLEAAGTVRSIGRKVTRLKPGDRVMATLVCGGMAEQAVAREAECMLIPERMSIAEAGAFPVAYLSSDVALRWQARLAVGDTLLVLGAAGGIGLTAIEIGKAMGARVIAAASTAEKLNASFAHGADDGINYTSEGLKERVMALTGNRGVDVCFDPVGGPLFDQALSSVAWGGCILLMGFIGGVPQIPANRLLVKHRAAFGSVLRYFRFQETDKLHQSAEALLQWYAEGKLRPHISHRLPFEHGVEAIKMLTERKALGKVVLLIDPECN